MEWINIPLQEDSKRSNDSSSKGMPIDNQNIVAHPLVQRNLSDNIHPCITKLQGDHGKVGFAGVQEASTASLSVHFLGKEQENERKCGKLRVVGGMRSRWGLSLRKRRGGGRQFIAKKEGTGNSWGGCKKNGEWEGENCSGDVSGFQVASISLGNSGDFTPFFLVVKASAMSPQIYIFLITSSPSKVFKHIQ